MKTFELSDFSDLLLDLYAQAAERPMDEFRDAALDLVRSVVPFDTSIWGTATMTAAGVDIHLIHLHRTSEDMLQAYEHVKHEDTSARSMMSRGMPTDGFHSPTAFARTDVGEFLRRFGHQNFFVSQEINPATGSCTAFRCIGLTRKRIARPKSAGWSRPCDLISCRRSR